MCIRDRGVDDSDGCRHANILVHDRGFQHSDTDVLAQMPKDAGTGIIQHLSLIHI